MQVLAPISARKTITGLRICLVLVVNWSISLQNTMEQVTTRGYRAIFFYFSRFWVRVIKEPSCSMISFDNFFTSWGLINYLRQEMDIFSLGTIRSNRLKGTERKMTTDKALKKKPRDSYSQIVCNNKICVVKWHDHKWMTIANSYVEAHTSTLLQTK